MAAKSFGVNPRVSLMPMDKLVRFSERQPITSARDAMGRNHCMDLGY